MNRSLSPVRMQSGAYPPLLDPWQAALGWGRGSVLAVLTATEGPAYREIGAAMAIGPDNSCAGALTSGCIEGDLVLRAAMIRENGGVQRLRYGRGSDFFDLRLPCGGGIDVMLFAPSQFAVLEALDRARKDRRPVSLQVSADGALRLVPYQPSADDAAGFTIGFRPAPRFVIFGAGPEALVFADLVAGLGYEHQLLTHDTGLLEAAAATGRSVQAFSELGQIDRLKIDAGTAVVLFYHDHDYEPGILNRALSWPAFYVGAQGGRSTQANRMSRLAEIGLSDSQMSRVRGPIGMLPSSRDPRTLALSVLAEIIGCYQAGA